RPPPPLRENARSRRKKKRLNGHATFVLSPPIIPIEPQPTTLQEFDKKRKGRLITDLNSRCKWPLHGRENPYLFCGVKIKDAVYCEFHRKFNTRERTWLKKPVQA